MALSNDLLKRIYRDMVRTRALDNQLIKDARGGVMQTQWHSGLGEEAIVGPVALLKKEDYTNNLFISDSKGKVWYPMARPFTTGAFYGSDYELVNEKEVILITGPNGADISFDSGQSWRLVVNKDLWSVDLLPTGVGWLVGSIRAK